MPNQAQHNIPIRIANIAIDLTSPLSAAELGIAAWLGPFCTVESPEEPLARVALRWEESAAPPVPRGDLIYDPGSIWKMYRAGQAYTAALTYQSEGRAAQAQGVLRANPTWDDLTLTEQRTGDALRPGSGQALRPGSGQAWQSLLNIGAGELILRTAILYTGGLVFHSSGLDDNGKGIVASGPICYGTPWGGTADIARNHAAPLTALIVLEQAPENAIQLIPPAAAASLLAARAFLPYWDAALMQRALANLTANGSSMIPFIRDGDVVELEPMGAALTVGDIVLAESAAGHYVIHRIVRLVGDHVWLRGDAQERREGPVPRRAVLGRAVTASRNGRVRALDRGGWRLAGRVWMRCAPLGVWLLRLIGFARRVGGWALRRL